MTQIVDTVTRESNEATCSDWVGDDHPVARSGVEMDRSVKFWNWIAQRYSKRPVADEASYQKKLGKTREYFQPDMQVLEVGCGTGSTAIAHAPYVAHIRATDISPSMIEIARGKAEAAAVSNVDFEVSSIDDLQVHDASQDAVLALSILHLLEDERAAIARVHRMLKPGGVLVTSTPCLRDAWKKRRGNRVDRAAREASGLATFGGPSVHPRRPRRGPDPDRIRYHLPVAPRGRQGRLHRGEEAGERARLVRRLLPHGEISADPLQPLSHLRL